MDQALGITVRSQERFYIGGHWVDPLGDGRIDVQAPASQTTIGTIPEATTGDADRAVAAAREAFDAGPWPWLSPVERAQYLARFLDELEARRAEAVATQSAEMGLPMMMSAGHFDNAVTTGRVFVDAASRLPVEEIRTHVGATARVRHEPIGVLLGIVPWNAPFVLGMLKLGAALVAGCTVILRPAIEAPLCTQILAEAIDAAELPEGVVTILPADREVSEHLVRHPGVDKVSFTGSTPVGKEIMKMCAERVVGVTLELGGKSAMIVLDDADLAAAAAAVVPGACSGSGQVCSALTRVIVSAERHDELIDAIAGAMADVTVGDPADPETMMGPLASAAQYERVMRYIEVGKAEGATLVRGGSTPDELDGWYVEPTLFSDVTPDMRIAREEIFGPVVSVITCRDDEDAIRIANESDFGLHGAVFTSDIDRGLEVARRIRAGTFQINAVLPSTLFPYSGHKGSGLGVEGDIEGIEDCRQTKQILVAG